MHFAKKIKHSLLFNFNLISTTSQGFNEMILKASNSQNYQRNSTIKDSFYMYAILYMRGREKIFVEMGALTWRAWVVAVRFRELGRWLVLACVLMVHQRLSPLLMSQLVRWYHTHINIIYIRNTLLLMANRDWCQTVFWNFPFSLKSLWLPNTM